MAASRREQRICNVRSCTRREDTDVPVRTRAFGRSRASVIGAIWSVSFLIFTGAMTHMAVEPVKLRGYGPSPSAWTEAELTSQCLVWGLAAKSVPGISASAMMTVYICTSECDQVSMRMVQLTPISPNRVAFSVGMMLSSGEDPTAVGVSDCMTDGYKVTHHWRPKRHRCQPADHRSSW